MTDVVTADNRARPRARKLCPSRPRTMSVPELPEVQTVVNTLRPHVAGRRICAMALARADFARPIGFDWPTAVAGSTVLDISRRAKRIVFDLDRDRRFFAHLGMTGRITVGPRARPPAPHTHATLLVEGEVELHFTDPRRFGGLRWLGTEPADDAIGPEPLSLRPAVLARRLAATRRAVKTALLDQRLIAGLGNIYVDEALHAAGIHPLAACCELTADEVGRLNRAIKATLRRALRHRGSTLRDYRDADGVAGGFQKLHRVYDRAGQPCHRCATALNRIVLGGRSTHFCPRCQPARGGAAPS